MRRVLPHSHLQRKAQALLWLLVLGFVCLQWLGTVHRQVHANAGGYVQWMPAHSSSETPDLPESTACQLFDLACSGMALVSAWPLLVAPSFWLWSLGLFSLDDPALEYFAFEARGPPVLI